MVTTLLGIGAIPETHPLCLGMAGMHGEAYANMALQRGRPDHLAWACRFDDRLTGPVDQFAQQAKVIHVDIDPAEIDKNVPVDLAVVGDLKDVLPALVPLVDAGRPRRLAGRASRTGATSRPSGTSSGRRPTSWCPST